MNNKALILILVVMFQFVACGEKATALSQCFTVEVKKPELKQLITSIEEFSSLYNLHQDDRSKGLSELMGRVVIFITYNDGPPIQNILILKNTGSGFIVEVSSLLPDGAICKGFKNRFLPELRDNFEVVLNSK